MAAMFEKNLVRIVAASNCEFRSSLTPFWVLAGESIRDANFLKEFQVVA